MGNCKSAADRSQEEYDNENPPLALQVEDLPHPAPITVDLDAPEVDVNAPLDERDIDLVQQTFARVAMLGADNVGWVLFMNIFAIAPGAKDLFPFKDDDLATSARMRKHAANVVGTVATAVSLLRDLDTLVPVLKSLGLRHVGYNVIPAHYDVVGQALIKSLTTALGPSMTPAVTNAYLKVFTIVKNTMISDCNYPAEGEAPAAEASPEEAPKGEEAPAPAAEAAPEGEAAPAEAAAEAAAEPEAAVAEAPAEAAAEAETAPAEATEKKVDGHKDKKASDKKADSKGNKKAPDHSAKKKKEEEKKKAEGAKKAEEEAKAAGPPPEEQLRAAAAKGDDKTVAKLIKEKVNINAADADGKTALHLAAEAGEIEICSRLTMAKGIKVNLKTSTTKETALHMACQKGLRDLVVVIVRAGADLKATTKAGKTAVQLTNDQDLSNWLSGTNPAGTNPPWQGTKMR